MCFRHDSVRSRAPGKLLAVALAAAATIVACVPRGELLAQAVETRLTRNQAFRDMLRAPEGAVEATNRNVVIKLEDGTRETARELARIGDDYHIVLGRDGRLRVFNGSMSTSWNQFTPAKPEEIVARLK